MPKFVVSSVREFRFPCGFSHGIGRHCTGSGGQRRNGLKRASCSPLAGLNARDDDGEREVLSGTAQD